MKTISTEKYELVGVRRVKLSTGLWAQVATRRREYSPDRLYAWRGRHTEPKWETEQGSSETDREFVESL